VRAFRGSACPCARRYAARMPRTSAIPVTVCAAFQSLVRTWDGSSPSGFVETFACLTSNRPECERYSRSSTGRICDGRVCYSGLKNACGAVPNRRQEDRSDASEKADPGRASGESSRYYFSGPRMASGPCP